MSLYLSLAQLARVGQPENSSTFGNNTRCSFLSHIRLPIKLPGAPYAWLISDSHYWPSMMDIFASINSITISLLLSASKGH